MFDNLVQDLDSKSKNAVSFLVLGIFSILIFGFIFLAFLVSYNPVLRIDVAILNWVQSFTFPTLATIMAWVSFFGEVYVAPILLIGTVIFLYVKGLRKEALLTPTILLGFFVSTASKEWIGRPRPGSWSLDLGYPTPSDYSFPSGHVVFYTLLFGILAFLALLLPRIKKKWRIAIFAVSGALIGLVGLSRVYLGVHWPSDVIGGYLIGFALLELFVLGYLKFAYLPKIRNKQDSSNSNSKK